MMKKRNRVTALIMFPLALIVLQGCNNSSNSTTSNAVQTLSSQSADSEPNAITASLSDDITTLFKTADDEPIVIEDGDSLTDVFNRSGG